MKALVLTSGFFLFSLGIALGSTPSHREPHLLLSKIRSGQKTNKEKAILWNKISWSYYENFNDSALFYAQHSLDYAERKRQKKQLVLAQLQIAEIYRSERELALAYEYLEKAKKTVFRSYPVFIPKYCLFLGNLEYTQRNNSNAQNAYQKGLEASKRYAPKQQAAFYIQFSKLSLRSGDIEKAETNLLKAVELAEKHPNVALEIKAHNGLGNLHARSQQLDKAKIDYQTCLSLSKKHKDKRSESRAYLNIGNLYYYKGYWTTAIEYYIKSAALKEAINDLNGLAKIHNNIGALYKEQERYDKSIEYYNKSAQYYQNQQDSVRYIETQINIAVAKIFQGKAEEARQLLQQNFATIASFERQDLLLSNRLNLSFAYSELKQYSNSMRELERCRDIATTLSDKHSLVIIENLIGTNNFHLQQYPLAIQHYNQSLLGAKELDMLSEQSKALFGLYEAEQKLGDFKQSLRWFEEYSSLKDSLFNANSTNRLNEIQEQYDSKQKALEIDKLKARNKAVELENELTRNELRYSRLLIGGGTILVIVALWVFYQRIRQHKARNTFEKKQNEARIKNLISDQEAKTYSAIIETQQKERSQLARDLHDTLGSYLATLKYQHESSKHETSVGSNVERFQKTATLIDNTAKELRAISHRMATGESIRLDLVMAVETLVNRIKDTGHFSIEFNALLEDKISEHIELTLYKVIQELLANILKHANADHITIQLIQHENEISLVVEDDGKGFDPKTTQNNGIGLNNVTERIHQIHGTLEIDAQPGNGVTIVILVPLDKIIADD